MPVTNPPLFNWWEVRKERQHPPSAGNIDLIFQIIQRDAMGGPHHQGFWKGVWCDTYKGSLISISFPSYPLSKTHTNPPKNQCTVLQQPESFQAHHSSQNFHCHYHRASEQPLGHQSRYQSLGKAK